jgi:hypothetical protein
MASDAAVDVSSRDSIISVDDKLATQVLVLRDKPRLEMNGNFCLIRMIQNQELQAQLKLHGASVKRNCT